ncbi:MAG: HIT domain-containing protein [Pseudolabrys sp.]|jgi:diadenosine tetraphosphate (Ap4A) HIT family hydrolase
MPETPFALHPQLAADTVPVGDLRLCRVLLSNDANYPWLILVPRRPGVTELIDLADEDRGTLTAEIDAGARAVKAMTGCDKLNVAALGNVVPQLHIHVIARRHSDPAWPRPVWGAVPAVAYQPALRDGFIAALRRALGIQAVTEL